jgi:hypothetical protein
MDGQSDRLADLVERWTESFAGVAEVLTGRGIEPGDLAQRFRQDAVRIRARNLDGLENLIAGFEELGLAGELTYLGGDPEAEQLLAAPDLNDPDVRFYVLAHQTLELAAHLRHEHYSTHASGAREGAHSGARIGPISSR